ncbi:DUF4157 domain-containing protein [Trinickia violacea]|uniref:DUF4157 domain-containing protein n=1 Tax=Trinickia violacea TaxID=2571746 RepID=A0A4P8ILL4_9BURK|nr:DUF4157 domain-containing protein [Trinickia violacea]QCP49798.1 DUF4157 domain-containing protein [Trinickia violacea]
MSEREQLDSALAATSLARRNDERLAAAIRIQPASPGAAVARDPVDRVACRIGDASCASAHAGVLSRSKRLDGAGAQQSLLRLQRDFGNQYVGRVLSRVAGEGEQAQDMTAIERSIDSARGGGHGMDHGTRARMEAAFGADFSDVRIHTDAKSDSLNGSLAARAFTTGRDVFFRHGEYSPGSSSGRELLAHELTHVVQQNGDGLQRKMTVSEPGDPQEVEADQMARAVIQQEQMQAVDRAVPPLESASCHGGTSLCRDPNS